MNVRKQSERPCYQLGLTAIARNYLDEYFYDTPIKSKQMWRIQAKKWIKAMFDCGLLSGFLLCFLSLTLGLAHNCSLFLSFFFSFVLLWLNNPNKRRDLNRFSRPSRAARWIKHALCELLFHNHKQEHEAGNFLGLEFSILSSLVCSVKCFMIIDCSPFSTKKVWNYAFYSSLRTQFSLRHHKKISQLIGFLASTTKMCHAFSCCLFIFYALCSSMENEF